MGVLQMAFMIHLCALQVPLSLNFCNCVGQKVSQSSSSSVPLVACRVWAEDELFVVSQEVLGHREALEADVGRVRLDALDFGFDEQVMVG